jgi:hypothetical protein
MADTTQYPYVPMPESGGRKFMKNVGLPLAAVLETILTAKASRGANVGKTSLSLLGHFDEEDRRREEAREKAIERAADANFRKADDARQDKMLSLREKESKSDLELGKRREGREEARFQSEVDKDHRELIQKEKAVQRMLGIPTERDDATNTVSMGRKGIQGLSDLDKEAIQQDPQAWINKQIAQQKEFAPPKPGGSARGGGGGGGSGIKLTAGQQTTLADIAEANGMLNSLAQSFNQTGMAQSPGKAFAADVVESVPFVGGKIAPKTAQYNDNRRITAEKFLRAATGAAAPEKEVKFYASLLPEPGDDAQQAQNAIDAFRSAVKDKALSISSALKLQGRDQDAQEIEGRINDLFAMEIKIDAPAKTGGVDRRALAREALNDPESTAEEKAQAKRILGIR